MKVSVCVVGVKLLWVGSWLFAVCAVSAPVDLQTNHAAITTVPGVNTQRLAVVVNDSDIYSVAVAEYYAKRRNIPAANVIHVRFAAGRSAISAEDFDTIRTEVIARTPIPVQAFAITWLEPYRVDCMSITAAFAFGFDREYCAEGCHLTRRSAYFNAHTHVPADILGIFPTMSIAAPTVDEAKALIDRGIASDGSRPTATAYLVSSDDVARNVRARFYDAVKQFDHRPINVAFPSLDTMHNRDDVMVYFVGARQVEDMTTNRFLPGAVADHLTSTGGDLLHTHQMSSLKWIEAGATGSYGSVVEPCAYVEKFPDPAVFMRFYLAGETLIESYWKSVVMPGQGIFIGEPLARPFVAANPDRK